MLKQKLGNLFKENVDRDGGHLKEQVDILHKLLISKEEDLKSKESQFHLVGELWKEKERKMQNQMQQKDQEIRQLEQRLLEAEENSLQIERKLADYEGHLERERSRSSGLEERLRTKEEALAAHSRAAEKLRRELAASQALLRESEAVVAHLEGKIGEISVQLESRQAAELTSAFLEASAMTQTQDSPRGDINGEMAEILVRASHGMMESGVRGLLESVQDEELRERLLEMAGRMNQQVPQFESMDGKVRLVGEMVEARERVLEQQRKRVEQVQHELALKEAEELQLSHKIRDLEERLGRREESTESKRHKHAEHMTTELKIKGKQIESMQDQLERLSREMEEKEKNIESLFSTVHAAELELEEKESEFFHLTDKLLEYKTRLKQREKELKELGQKTSKLEESIEESDAMVLTYSGIYKAKEESLKAKEEIVLHFEDLLKQTEEKIRVRDEQVARMYEDLSIIDNYSTK